MKQLILASTSVYRQELLKRLGLPFQVASPGIDEDAEKAKGFKPQALAERLAEMKAAALSSDAAVVIGGDQLVDFEGQILGKPGSEAAAVQQLQSLAGKTHRLITAVCVSSSDGNMMITDITRLTLRKLSLTEIERYVQADRPLDCAGAYKIEQQGVALMEKIETEDSTAIQGLPLIKLAQALRKKGFLIP